MNKGLLLIGLAALVSCTKSADQLSDDDRTRKLSLSLIPDSQSVSEQVIGYVDNDSTHEHIKYVAVQTFESKQYPTSGGMRIVNNQYLTDFIGVCEATLDVYHGGSTISQTRDSSMFPSSKAIDVRIKEDTRYYSDDSLHCIIIVRDCRHQTDSRGNVINDYDYTTKTYK